MLFQQFFSVCELTTIYQTRTTSAFSHSRFASAVAREERFRLLEYIFRLSLALLTVFLLHSTTFAQESSPSETVIISGVVREAASGEFAIGTAVALYSGTFVENSRQKPFRGAITNKYGFYTLPSVPKGAYTLVVRRTGFATFTQAITIDETRAGSPQAGSPQAGSPQAGSPQAGSERVNVELIAKVVRMESVSVQAERTGAAAVSTVDVSVDFIKQMPALGGERDIFRVLQLMPGVKSVSEISSGLYVRGGSPDQNLILLDGVTVYNPQHLGGFLSAFNTDAVSNVRLIKGAFPAEYGGRLSSVLDMSMKEGSKEKIQGTAGISLISLSALLEGPISSNATFMVSGRRMYFDLAALAIDPGGRLIPRYNFYDGNAKVNLRLDDNNQFFLSGYIGRDIMPRLNAPDQGTFELDFGNITANARWAHIFSPSVFGNFSLIYTDYDFRYAGFTSLVFGGVKQFETASRIQDLTLRSEVQWFPLPGHSIKTGIEATRHNFLTDILSGSEVLRGAASFQERADPLKRVSSLEIAAFAQDEWEITENLITNIGLRTAFFELGSHLRFEPRASLAYKATNEITFKAAFAVASQFLHLLQDNGIALPTDTWFPSTEILKPARSTQYVLGMETYLFDREWFFTVEGYYKGMENLYEFREDARFVPGTIAEALMTSGTGEAYGVEFFLNKQIGALTGWLGYTLSWTTRLFPELNGGRPFFPRYDRRHDVVVALSYKLNDRWDFGATWTFASGQGLTVANGIIENTISPSLLTVAPAFSRTTSGVSSYVYGDRNAFRLPDYHRLDINATYKFPWIGGLPFEFSLNLYNVYNRLNPFTAWVETSSDGRSRVRQLTLLPFVPTVGLRCTF